MLSCYYLFLILFSPIFLIKLYLVKANSNKPISYYDEELIKIEIQDLLNKFNVKYDLSKINNGESNKYI